VAQRPVAAIWVAKNGVRTAAAFVSEANLKASHGVWE
jgi:hypothetical protein